MWGQTKQRCVAGGKRAPAAKHTTSLVCFTSRNSSGTTVSFILFDPYGKKKVKPSMSDQIKSNNAPHHNPRMTQSFRNCHSLSCVDLYETRSFKSDNEQRRKKKLTVSSCWTQSFAPELIWSHTLSSMEYSPDRIFWNKTYLKRHPKGTSSVVGQEEEVLCSCAADKYSPPRLHYQMESCPKTKRTICYTGSGWRKETDIG